MFRASLCPSSGEQRPCYCIWCVVLVLLDVVVIKFTAPRTEDTPAKWSEKMAKSTDAPACAIPLARGG